MSSSDMSSACSSSPSAVAEISVPKPTRPSGDEIAFHSSQSATLVLWTVSSGTASTKLFLAFLRIRLLRHGPHGGVKLIAGIAQILADLEQRGIRWIESDYLRHGYFGFL